MLRAGGWELAGKAAFCGESQRFDDWHAHCIHDGREENMNTSIMNYPGFQNLPKGARQMLLFSETHFFNEDAARPAAQADAARERRSRQALRSLMTRLTIAAGIPSDAPTC
jgi:hypothetical protein